MRGITFAESARLLSMRESRILRRLHVAGALAVLDSITRAHRVSAVALLGRARRVVLVRARHALWAALHALRWTMARIAKVVEVDRKSVAYALDKRPAQLAPMDMP